MKSGKPSHGRGLPPGNPSSLGDCIFGIGGTGDEGLGMRVRLMRGYGERHGKS